MSEPEGGHQVNHHEQSDSPTGRMKMYFQPQEQLADVDDDIKRDVSAVAVIGRTLFIACDETATVERLILNDDGEAFERHRDVALGDFFELPAGRRGEMDIEGLSVDGGYLWVTGSHSLIRNKLPDEGDIGDRLLAMAECHNQPNRHFLGRVPLKDRGEGVFEPVAEVADERTPACLKMHGRHGRSRVYKMLSRHPLMRPFMDVPCKENGFDVEGLAVTGERVFLGLRGPVVGRRGMVVEMHLKLTGKGYLKPRRIGTDGQRFRLHLLDLEGFGVRDLLFADDRRLLILAGATSDIEGMQSIYAWPGALAAAGDSIADDDAVSRVLDLPFLRDADHAEGLAAIEVGGEQRLLVAYDDPAAWRVDDEANSLVADLFPLAQ